MSLDQAQHHSFIIRRSLPFFIAAVGAYSKSHSSPPIYHCHWDVAFSPALWFSNPDCTLEAPVSFYKLPVSWPLLRYSDLSGLGVAQALGFLESSLVISKLQLKLRTTGLVKFGRRKKTSCEVLSYFSSSILCFLTGPSASENPVKVIHVFWLFPKLLSRFCLPRIFPRWETQKRGQRRIRNSDDSWHHFVTQGGMDSF